MKSILVACLFFVIHFGSVAQYADETFFASHYNDSNYVKNRGIYMTFSPTSSGISINTDTDEQYRSISIRLGVHWMTRNYQKFQWFGSFGEAYKSNGDWMTLVESGLMMGKIIHGRKRGYLDLNIGVAYFSRMGNSHSFDPENLAEVFNAHTVGIPFEAMAYTSKLPIGIGIGLNGNLNVNQPYINLSVQFRLGNPIRRKYAMLNRYRIVE